MSTTTIATLTEKKAGSSKATVKTAVVGVGGYAGAELARLLLNHPSLKGTAPLFLGRMADGKEESNTVTLEGLHPQLALGASTTQHAVKALSWKLLADEGIEVIFLATPHEASREWVPELLARGLRVIDLSGAWRLHDAANSAVYKLEDKDAALAASIQKEAVFGSPELHAAAIKKARLVANPGCYSTSVILALAPLVKAGLVDTNHGIIADSKSGVSGAGKAPTAGTHFMYAADNLSAYKVFGHRHTGEIVEQLGIATENVQFTPHLLPIPRGILSTIYVRLNKAATAAEIEATLRSFYANSPLVRIHAAHHLPQIQHVVRTNYCDIGFELSKDGKRLVLVSCLDNLLKGAAGQAVQNMNLMCGFEEAEGLA
jgi:N-acetyl-gamma-glutamyl-phosphate reductase